MATSPLSDFIERAKSAGIPDESIVGVLSGRGWQEKVIYEALAAHYERTIGAEAPRRGGGPTAAKDAFFYLLIFSTLATWTVGFGALCFSLIEIWLPDTLFSSNYYQGYQSSNIAGSISAVIVAFPIFLLVSRRVLRDITHNPEKLNSPVRKWLTYLALVIAAGVFIGDLIAVLTHFLRGEITSRFLSEAFVVLVLSCGVLIYYFAGLRKTEERAPAASSGGDAWVAAGVSLVVAVILVLGFLNIGGPGRQRALRADRRRVQDIAQLATRVTTKWRLDHSLPQRIENIPTTALDDPVTRRPYDYHPKQGDQYEICATFSFATEKNEANGQFSEWMHPAGYFCYQLNASQQYSIPPFYDFN